jgi:nifR3 family TIM-barrel protein
MTVQSLGKQIRVGNVVVPGRVWIAPMTGVTDLSFREVAASMGASYLATEMVACAQFAQGRPDVVRRAAVGAGLPLMVVQLVGRDPNLIAAGARLAEAAGAAIIDLNFGCPAKEVTGHLSGSAIMREPVLAEALAAAAADAVAIPVTVKMRLGWDDATRNAPEIAARVQAAGACAITVHARTRCQFYGGAADWAAVRQVKAEVDIPVIVNGDVVDRHSATRALEVSGADGVMIGRAAVGRPWIAACLEAALRGETLAEPAAEARATIVANHLQASIRRNGPVHGVRLFRKHLAAYIDAAPWSGSPADRREARSRLCRLDTAGDIIGGVSDLWSVETQRIAA